MSVRDYDKINTITRIISKFGDINVKHRINLKSKFINSDSSVFIFNDIRDKDKISGSLKATYDSIVLESNITPTINTGGYSKKPSAMISYGDVVNTERLFNEVSKWFTDDNYKNHLFLYKDNDSKPYKISDQFRELSCVINLSIGLDSFLSIQPGIISDMLNNVAYPGVYFRSNLGLIGSCTMTEFFDMKICLFNLLNNLYSISLNLLTNFMLIANEK